MNVFFVSLGCDKNLVDTERMLGALERDGFTIIDDENAADVIVINTCCFINDAKEESIQSILEMAELRKKGRCKALIVTGCLAQRYQKEIMDEIPEVDAVLGTMSFDHLIQAIRDVLKGGTEICLEDVHRSLMPPGKRLLTTGGHYAYLKIAEGCNKNCSYCIIPKIRGRFRSFPMEDLIREAEQLVSDGVKELILVAQETTLYGVDLYGEKQLHVLIRKLCAIPGVRWVRLLYCYPEEIYEQLIETMKEEPKFCHYLDLPIQHASDHILGRMGRRTNRDDLIRIITHLREEIPDIILRTTLISGFPGETREDHEILMDFVDRMEFDRLGVFPYSAEENTKAAEMPDQIPEETKEERRGELMELQQEIAFAKAEERIGQKMWAMVEGKVADEEVYVCRGYADAPNVDGYIFVNSDEQLMSGDFVFIKVTGAYEYDLLGEIV